MKYCVILFMGMLFTKSLVHAQVVDSVYYEQPSEYTGEYTEEYTPAESSYPPVNPGEVSRKKGYDTEPIDVMRFDRQKWEGVVGGTNYSEEKPAVKEKEKKKWKQQERDSVDSPSSNSDKRFEQSRQDEAEDPESSSSTASPINSPVLTIVVYALAIGIIGYILFLIIKNTSLKSKGKLSKSASPDQSAPVEDIKELEIDRLLREAMTSGNYRLVIRIYFLGLLQKLDEDGFIAWKKDKTNRDYLSELYSKAHYFEEVKSLTRAYEQVWYGDHTLPVQTYEMVISSFKAIDQKLKASKPQ